MTFCGAPANLLAQGQLLVLTALMFVGGEVFISLLGLASKWSKLRRQAANRSRRIESHDDKGCEFEMRVPVAEIGRASCRERVYVLV